jgi:hypothetical protein
VLETDDPIEIVTELMLLKDRPRLVARMRKRGRATAKEYVWDKVIDLLGLRIGFAAARQAVTMPVGLSAPKRTTVGRTGAIRA